MFATSAAFRPNLTALEVRDTPAVTATFLSSVLSVVGDGAANDIVVSADSAGNLVVTNNGAAVRVRSVLGAATKFNLTTVNVDARGGNDTVTLDRSLNVLDANGKLAAAPGGTLNGNGGNDTIRAFTGGFRGGVIDVNGIIGNLVMDGGGGSDFLDSGFGNDVMLGGDGNDTLRWLPGTLVDLFDGEGGTDTGIVVGNGNNQGDAFVLAADPANPGQALFQRTNLIPFFIPMISTENVVLQTDSGDDTITVGNLAGTGVRSVTADGGAGNDTIDGSATAVPLTLTGGEGDDVLVGGGGNDVLFGLAGNDRLTGNRGFDVLTGGDGDDDLDDGVKDGKQDVLSGGTGADTFVRRQTNRTGPPTFDELVIDLSEADGDALDLIPPV